MRYIHQAAAVHRRRGRRATGRFVLFLAIVLIATILIFFLLNAFPFGISRAADEGGLTPLAGAQQLNETMSAGETKPYTVIIDAGHGGKDFGTTGAFTGRKEKEVNLEIACRVRDLLEQEGIHVIMTRENDDMIAPTKEEDMKKREDIIRDSNADLFVSIHQNFYDKGEDIHGPQVFYREEGAPGQELAKYIQRSLNEKLEVDTPRQPNAGDYQLLRPGNQPSVIVECGFFSNRREEELLQDDDYQQRLAQAVVDGIDAYRSQKGQSGQEL